MSEKPIPACRGNSQRQPYSFSTPRRRVERALAFPAPLLRVVHTTKKNQSTTSQVEEGVLLL